MDVSPTIMLLVISGSVLTVYLNTGRYCITLCGTYLVHIATVSPY